LIQIFKQFQNFNEQKVRRLVGNAVDNSIVEILPPVVDRSVTIALITTRELVLKDFAYDGDYKRVLEAADLIVQNLAGSLALVTCREPLRMSLTTNLKKIFDQHFKCELGLDILSSSNT
jgi:CCR4-NOT transcription complex subunit 1